MNGTRTLSVSRVGLISRIAAALFGGYALAYCASAALAVLLPVPRSEAVVIAVLTGLLIYASAIMWVFSARTAARAWLVLLLLILPCAVVIWLPGILT